MVRWPFRFLRRHPLNGGGRVTRAWFRFRLLVRDFSYTPLQVESSLTTLRAVSLVTGFQDT